jgi:hypothetical protein
MHPVEMRLLAALPERARTCVASTVSAGCLLELMSNAEIAKNKLGIVHKPSLDALRRAYAKMRRIEKESCQGVPFDPEQHSAWVAVARTAGIEATR